MNVIQRVPKLDALMERQHWPDSVSRNPFERNNVRRLCQSYTGNGSLTDFFQHARDMLGIVGDPAIVGIVKEIFERKEEFTNGYRVTS